MDHRSSRLLLACSLIGALATQPAVAQDDASDRSTLLFREARQLLAEGRLREACEKFDQSLELRRSPGTLLNVGSCRASMGDMVGAIDAFGSAVAMAERQPPSDKAQSQIDAGRRELDRVRARVAHLSVSVPEGEDVRVTLDGKALERLGVWHPMNPGLHRIEAEAVAGGRRFERDLTLKEAEAQQITIPSLRDTSEALDVVSVPVQPVPEPASPSRPVPTASWILLGSGGALLLASGVTGLLAYQRKSELERDCLNGVCPHGYGPLEDANTLTTATNVLFGVSAAAVLTGVGLWLFTSPEDPSAQIGVVCSGASRCGVQLDARF